MARISPYSSLYEDASGAGDARPTALQILKDDDLVGKLPRLTMLITGCSSGIGLATAEAAFATGAKVYVTARDLAKAQQKLSAIDPNVGTLESRLQILPLDLSDFDSVRRLAKDFLARSDKLNILIANAGLFNRERRVRPDGLEEQFAANHLGHFLLFMLLKDTLLASSTSEFQSRVVNVSSVSHRTINGIRFDDLSLEKEGWEANPYGGYSHAKLANVYMANALERRYGAKGLHAFSLQPGGVATEIFREYFTQEQIKAMYGSMSEKNVMTAEQGAAGSIWAAVGKVWEGKGGKYLENAEEARPAIEGENWTNWWVRGYAPWTYNEEAEERLWKESLRLLGLENEK